LSVQVEIKINPGLFQSFPIFLNRELKTASFDISKRLMKTARDSHRYTKRTGNLTNNTVTMGNLSDDNGLKLFVDLNKANYGLYVIKGHRSWGEDAFLNNALDVNYTWIVKTIQNAVDRAIDSLNRSRS